MSDKNEVLKAVIDFERMGYGYYAEVATKSINPLTRKVFESLAAQEKDHIVQAEAIFAGRDLSGFSRGNRPDLEEIIKGCFVAFSSEERQAWKMDNAEAYLRAMDLERQGCNMYEQLAAKTEDAETAGLFRRMQGEEEKHFEALENTYAYFADPGDWQHEDERLTWNWMNT